MQKPLQTFSDKLLQFISTVSSALNNSGQRINRTENQHLEEQLKTLSTAVEQSSSTIMITDTSGKIEYVNPKFTQLTGYTSKEAIEQNPRILKTDKTPPEVHECLWKAITSGKEWRGEFCNRKKNGELYWESASISPVKNSKCAITNFVAVKEDITERKKMEEKLNLFNKYLEECVSERTEKLREKNTKLLNEIVRREQAEEILKENVEKFQKITSSAFDTIIMMDDEGKVSFWNEAAESMFGYSMKEAVGKDLHKMIVPDRYYDAFQKGMEGFIKDGTGLVINKSLVLPGLRRDGTEFLADHSFSSVKLKGRWHAISIIRDITERKQAERKLKETKEMLSRAQQVSNMGSWEWDKVNDEVIWSEETCHLFGLKPDEFDGKYETFLNFVHPEDRELVTESVKASLLRKETYNIDFRIVLRNGIERIIHSEAQVEFDNVDTPIRMTGISQDITERKRMEINEKRAMFTTNFSRSCRDFVELKPVTELATKGLAELLNVQRASVWLLDDSGNLVCHKLYEHPKGCFSDGTVLSGERYPDYLKAILSDCPVDAHNARTDPRTKEFLNDYLTPLYIYSMLDVPVKLKGRVSGVLCLEQTEHARKWQKDEIDFANTITAQLSSAIDRITESKNADAELTKSYNLLHSIIEEATDTIFVKDLSGRYLLINSSGAHMIGKPIEEIIGKDDTQLFTHDIAHRIIEEDRAIIDSGEGRVFDEEIPVNGKMRTFHTTKVPYHDEIGNIVGVIGISRDMTERKRVDEHIKSSLKEKEVLLEEVHHRVKNNLQIISSLLDMSSMQAHNKETIELFAESRNRVNSIALIHSQLYDSERFDEIVMERHIHELSGNLLKIYSKEDTITLDIKSANVCLPVTQAVPCALVLNELISNSLKHAYREGQHGIISISLQHNVNTILMRVKDDGVGIPEDIDLEVTTSLGLKLVRNIVKKQFNGIMKLIRDKGTEFIIEFSTYRRAHEKSDGSRR